MYIYIYMCIYIHICAYVYDVSHGDFPTAMFFSQKILRFFQRMPAESAQLLGRAILAINAGAKAVKWGGCQGTQGLEWKTIGKPWENLRKNVGKWWFNGI